MVHTTDEAHDEAILRACGLADFYPSFMSNGEKGSHAAVRRNPSNIDARRYPCSFAGARTGIYKRSPFRRTLEASRAVCARPQHRDPRGFDRAKSDRPRCRTYLNLALDNGVKPQRDLRDHYASGVLLRLGKCDVGGRRREGMSSPRADIGPDQLPQASLELLPLNEAAEKERATSVDRISAQSRRASSSTPPMSSSAISGCVRTCAERSEPGDGERADCFRPGCAGHLPPQPGDGQRLDAGEASEVLTHLAFYSAGQRLLRASGRQDVFEKRATLDRSPRITG